MEGKPLETLEDLQAEARAFAARLSPKEGGATVVALYGELGAGKTSFVQGIAAYFGAPERVVSPTFILERIYALSDQPFERLVHIDAYRLTGAEELSALGWNDITREPGNLVCVEWAGNLEQAIPEDAHRVRLAHTEEGTRTVSYGS